ncbi:unnamed protein product [Heterobilharzia americana]|nr:unnamed protein product [Heterobilharzia americana]
MYSYQLKCSCGETYIGRTTRQLNKRGAKHLPLWLRKGQVKSIRSSILSHLVDSSHVIDKTKVFKIIYGIPQHLPNGIRTRMLHTPEAMGIRENNPNLC